jgi:hypothetical protein
VATPSTESLIFNPQSTGGMLQSLPNTARRLGQLVAGQFGFAAVVDIGVGNAVPQACMGWISAVR